MDRTKTSGVERRLLILRHAKSSWADATGDDWERPLTDRGRRDATHVGQLLRRVSLVPDLIVSSDAVRAETTARLVVDAAGYAGKVVLSPALYHATPDKIVEVLRDVRDRSARSIMIVAHNPGLADLVARLTGERVEMSTAALANVALAIDEWRQLDVTTRGTLIDFWRPADL
jgi:phosphohistidine phosphatase